MIPTTRRQCHSPFIAFSRWCHLCNERRLFCATSSSEIAPSQHAPLRTPWQGGSCAVHDMLHAAALSRVMTATRQRDTVRRWFGRVLAIPRRYPNCSTGSTCRSMSHKGRRVLTPRSDTMLGAMRHAAGLFVAQPGRNPTKPGRVRTRPDAAREVLTVGPRASARPWGTGDPAKLMSESRTASGDPAQGRRVRRRQT